MIDMLDVHVDRIVKCWVSFLTSILHPSCKGLFSDRNMSSKYLQHIHTSLFFPPFICGTLKRLRPLLSTMVIASTLWMVCYNQRFSAIAGIPDWSRVTYASSIWFGSLSLTYSVSLSTSLPLDLVLIDVSPRIQTDMIPVSRDVACSSRIPAVCPFSTHCSFSVGYFQGKIKLTNR